LFWSQSQKSEDVGAAAKKLDARSLKFEYWLYSPAENSQSPPALKILSAGHMCPTNL